MEEIMGLYQHEIQTSRKQQFVDISKIIQQDIEIQEGICLVYTPHTTCAITVNENADPAVVNDMIYGYEKTFPTNDDFYHHAEGNSHAHMKSSVMGCSQSFIIHEGKLILGMWQGVYLCDFDGPRKRKIYVKTLSD